MWSKSRSGRGGEGGGVAINTWWWKKIAMNLYFQSKRAMIIKAKKTEQVVTWARMWLTRFNALIDKYLQCLPKLRNSHEINKFIWILRVKPSLRNLYRNYIYFSFKMLRCNKATEDAVLAKIHTCLRVDEAWVNSLPLE